jgi:hypothetical protein
LARARPDGAGPDHLAEINPVFEEPGEGALAEVHPAHDSTGGVLPPSGHDPLGLHFGLDGGQGLESEIAVEDHPHRVGLRGLNQQLAVFDPVAQRDRDAR